MSLAPTNTPLLALGQRRARLLLLRARMVPPDEASMNPPGSQTQALESVSVEDRSTPGITQSEPEHASAVARSVAALDPSRRTIALELYWRGDLIGEWRMTALDLGLLLDPEGVLALREHASPFTAPLGRVASYTWQALYHRLPRFVRQVTVDELRRQYSLTETLPVRVCEALQNVLRTRVPNRRVLWLEIGEPAGYLPLLAWERLLRPHVGVPIIRLPYHAVDAVSTHTTLDVLLTCSAPDVKPGTLARHVVSLATAILAAVPSGRRCVVHVFTDASCHDAVSTALRNAKGLPISTTEPPGGRGIVVYDLPLQHGQGASASPQSAEIRPDPTDHPWARWILDSLGGRAVDVSHVISGSILTSQVAALTAAAEPRRFDTSEYTAGASGVRMRYIDAQQMCDFAARMGAWAVVLSSLRPDDRKPHRVVMDRMAHIAPMVIASHELDIDGDAAAAQAIYQNLTSARIELPEPNAPRAAAHLVDSPAVCLYLPPARVLDWSDEVRAASVENWSSSNRSLANAYLSAKRSIRGAMELPEATPTWLAVSQRLLEQNVSNAIEAKPSTPEDRAAQEGISEALEIALHALAQSAESLQRSHEPPSLGRMPEQGEAL